MKRKTNTKTAPSGASATVALKESYRWRLLAVFAANLIVLYAAIHYDTIQLDGLRSLAADWQDVLKNSGLIAVALAITTILNGLLPSDAKFRLVFWRWQHPLPGSRAFSWYVKRDTRIDFPTLERAFGPLPTDPAAQNALWYRIYKTVQNHRVVLQTHRDFLFARDYAGLSALFLVFFGATGAYAITSRETTWFYLALLCCQYLFTAIAAQNYGRRLVTSAVAVWQKGI